MRQIRHRPKISITLDPSTLEKLDRLCPDGKGQRASRSRYLDSLVSMEFDRRTKAQLQQYEQELQPKEIQFTLLSDGKCADEFRPIKHTPPALIDESPGPVINDCLLTLWMPKEFQRQIPKNSQVIIRLESAEPETPL